MGDAALSRDGVRVIAYASRTGTKRNLSLLRSAGWRLILSPTGVLRTEGFRYALDNGAWTAFQAGKGFDGDAFCRAVDRFGSDADFIVVPDIVAGGLHSLDLSLQWLPRLQSARLLLVAVQDGMWCDDVRGIIGGSVGLFLGGTTEWKLRTMEMWGQFAKDERCYLHIARVNSCKRLSLCAAVGADSFDGSSASRFAVTLPNMDNARRQPDMFGPTLCVKERNAWRFST